MKDNKIFSIKNYKSHFRFLARTGTKFKGQKIKGRIAREGDDCGNMTFPRRTNLPRTPPDGKKLLLRGRVIASGVEDPGSNLDIKINLSFGNIILRNWSIPYALVSFQ